MLAEVGPGLHTWSSKDVGGFRAYAVSGDGEVVLVDPLPLTADEEAQVRSLGRAVAVLVSTMGDRPLARVLAAHGANLTEGAKERLAARIAQGP